MSFTNDPVTLTYVGDFSGLAPTELGFEITRGVPFEAPAEYAARQMGIRPTQWICDDPDVQAAATVIEAEEAAKLAELEREYMTPEQKEQERKQKIADDLDIPVEDL